MAIDQVRAYFKQYGMEERIQEFDTSSATVELAAADRENTFFSGRRTGVADCGGWRC